MIHNCIEDANAYIEYKINSSDSPKHTLFMVFTGQNSIFKNEF